MSGQPYLDGDTIDICLAALRDGRTLDDIAGRLHLDTELLGRLLQLPSTPADNQPITNGVSEQ
jgi:hypothetical protein